MSADIAVKPPLVLLTGFLGAGKTTLLNRVLGAQHRRRVGVIINELGRIDIDTRLIKSRSGDVLELAGGCVCHEVRVQSELWAAIAEVARRARPEVVVLETTGIAEPWSILDGLEGLGEAAPAVASGVVCAVDAEAGAGQIARHEEARAQIEAADRIVLTKLDLAAPDAVVALHRELARRNPAAERASFPPTDEATAELAPGCSTSGRRRGPARRTGRTTTVSSPPSPTATRRRCSASRCWRWWNGSARGWCGRRGSSTWPASPAAGFSSGPACAPSCASASRGATSRQRRRSS